MKTFLFFAAVAVVLPLAAFADLTGTTTLLNGQAFSFDTGAVSGSGADILVTVNSASSTITPQGTATAYNDGSSGSSLYNVLTQTLVQQSATAFSKSAIPSAVGLVFSVHTNGGNFAKALVTAQTSSSITIQYDTYGAGGGTPTVTAVLNNSSLVPAGFPNSGIAPSTLFVIEGTNLANAGTPTLQNTANGLPTQLNGASISVTVGGKTVQPAIYYTCSGTLNSASGCGSPLAPSLIAAVLPASTPLGTASLTVTVNNVASAPFTFQVVANALGFNNYYGGTVVAQNGYALVTGTSSAYPNEVITLWATGLGADPADSDTTFTSTPHSVSAPLTIYIGGVQANISYQGSAGYPGTDVINVTVPAGVPTGCYVPVVGVIGNVISNVVTIPVGNGICSDPQYGLNGTQISTLDGQSTVRSGALIVEQGTSAGVNGGAPSDIALATFSQSTGFNNGGAGLVSVGGCILNQTLTSSTTGTSTSLAAGTITVTTPSGSTITLAQNPILPGTYEAQLPSGSIPSTGGTFVFNSTAGTQVGAFGQVAVNFPNPLLSWTNQSAAATVTRSSGLSVTWTGGATGSYVLIGGSASSSTTGASGSYTCIASQSAGQFTVPSYILYGLPAGTGLTTVEDSTTYTSFTASGLDTGVALGAVAYQVNSTYQ